jgi:energy-coupling factor transport system permease protein
MDFSKKGILVLDPRTKILLLITVNIFIFTNHRLSFEAITVAGLLFLLIFSGLFRDAVKFFIIYMALLIINYVLLPISPRIIIMSLNIVIVTMRKLLPCWILGKLLIETTPIRLLMYVLGNLHIPQTVIIPLTISIRYFPAIKEEKQAISDAMMLRNVKGIFRKIEHIYVPLMISASNTADELSQAITARGIENPKEKTCVTALKFRIQDYLLLLVSIAFIVLIFI